MIAGGVSGLIYKCTKGFKASFVGGSLGILLVGSLNYATDYLRERDLITFEMKFDDWLIKLLIQWIYSFFNFFNEFYFSFKF